MPAPNTQPFSLRRYMGQWVVLAHVPAPFSARCGESTQQAHYELRGDGKVDVVNTCAGQRVAGVARVPDPVGRPDRLLVDFGFGVEGSYVIERIDENYSVALVGSDKRDLLWILARPGLSPSAVVPLAAGYVVDAMNLGYDTGRLVWAKGG